MVSSEHPATSSSPEWQPDPTHHLLLIAGPSSLGLGLPAFLARHPPATALTEKPDCRARLPASRGHVCPAASEKGPKLLASAWALLHLAGACPDKFHLSSVPCSLPLSPAYSPAPGLHFRRFLCQDPFLLPLGSGDPDVGATVGQALCPVRSGKRERPSPRPRELRRQAFFFFSQFFFFFFGCGGLKHAGFSSCGMQIKLPQGI